MLIFVKFTHNFNYTSQHILLNIKCKNGKTILKPQFFCTNIFLIINNNKINSTIDVHQST